MCVVVDEPGRHDMAGGVDDAGGARRGEAGSDRHDAIAGDGDIGPQTRRTGAVDDRAVRDEQVVARLGGTSRRQGHGEQRAGHDRGGRGAAHYSTLRMSRPVRRPPGPSFTCTLAPPCAKRARYE